MLGHYINKNKGTDDELFVNLYLILSSEYINNWNTWNGNELDDQIIDGVDSLFNNATINTN